MENTYLALLPKERKFKKVEKRLMRGCLTILENGTSLETISVTDLCSASSVSRTSFYSCFQSVVDVLRLIEDDLVLHFYRYLSPCFDEKLSSEEQRAFLSEGLDHILSVKADTLCLLALPFPNRYFIVKLKNVFKYIFFGKLSGQNCLDLYLEAASSSVVSTLFYWLKQPNEYRKEDTIDAFFGICHAYFKKN